MALLSTLALVLVCSARAELSAFVGDHVCRDGAQLDADISGDTSLVQVSLAVHEQARRRGSRDADRQGVRVGRASAESLSGAAVEANHSTGNMPEGIDGLLGALPADTVVTVAPNILDKLGEMTSFLTGMRVLITSWHDPHAMEMTRPAPPASRGDVITAAWLAAGCLVSAGLMVYHEQRERRRRACGERLLYPPRHLSARAWSVIISIDVLGSVSTDFFIPLVPIVMEELGTSAFAVGLSLAVNWVLKGVGDFCLGVLSERWGRVPVFMIGSLLYSTAALACSAAPSVGWLVLLRAVQGFGEANSDISTAVMRDVLEDTADRMRMNSLRWCVRSVALPAALLLGGILGAAIGWRNVFVLMGVWGLLNFGGAAFVLPETRPPETEETHSQTGFAVVVCQVYAVMTSATSCACIWMFILLFAGIYAVLSNVPLVFEDYFGIPVVITSVLMCTIPLVGLLLPTVFLAALSHSTPPLETMKVGMSVQLLAACLSFLFGLMGTPVLEPTVSAGAVLLVVWLMVSALGLCVAPLETIFLEPLGHVAGLASGLVAMTQTFLACALCLAVVAATERWEMRGMLFSLGAVMGCCQFVFWCILARTFTPLKPDPDPYGDW